MVSVFSPLDLAPVLGKLCGVYHNLDADKIVDTIRRLRDRIQARFPEAGLGRVAEELLRIAEKAAFKAEAIAKPYWPYRIGMGILGSAFLVLVGYIILHLKGVSTQVERYTELFQGVDSALNTFLLMGGAIFFLFTLEVRLKRNRAARAV